MTWVQLAKAYHANPNMLDYALAYAERLVGSKDFARARAAWERSLSINPQQDHVRENLDRIKKRPISRNLG